MTAFPLTDVVRLKRVFFLCDKSFQKSWQRTLYDSHALH